MIKKCIPGILVPFILMACTDSQPVKTSEPAASAKVLLDNGIISVSFDTEKATFSILDAKIGEPLLSDATFGLPSGERPAKVQLLKMEDVKDNLGTGKRVIVEVTDYNLFRYGSFRSSGACPAKQLFSYTLYKDNPALVLGFGLKTPNYISFRVTKSIPLAGGRLFGGRKIENPMTLNGAAGSEPTLVKTGTSRISTSSRRPQRYCAPSRTRTPRHQLQKELNSAVLRPVSVLTIPLPYRIQATWT